MTTTSRQNNIILNQDWKRIYQTFKTADFKSYDFENLRRVIITYLRENYPEDFNDYIESSEYMALIDAIAFLGQSLSFRVDLASRENFLELAERKDSVLRLARMLSYNAKRNIAANGLLKFATVATTEDIRDSNGKNLAKQIVSWNDPTNVDWAEQFILILNAAMADNTEFGRSQGSATIQGLPTEQYRLRTTSNDVPVYTFTKTIAGRSMTFEVVSTGFKNSESIYEEPPTPGNQLGFIYRNDNKGPGSANTGFYFMFKQGSLELADFTIDVPTTNETVSVNTTNVNNDDVWLFQLSSSGVQLNEWTKVSSLTGSNIVYNSLESNVRNIYSVVTRESDRVELVFADGVYGNLPQGPFRVYYRASNGLTYTIAPNEMKGINLNIPYVNKNGVAHNLTIGLSLQYTISNAVASEDIESIREKAPAVYYTQNRMITGEDYNLAPLSSSQDILKVRAVNRVSSGISRSFEVVDVTGKYSSINVFADDGFIYKLEQEKFLSFKFNNRIDIINFVRQKVEPLFSSTEVLNFYLSKFDKILFTDDNTIWTKITSDVNFTTGYFNETDGTLRKVGIYSTNSLKYLTPESMIKFVPPAGKIFNSKHELLDIAQVPEYERREYIWTKVIRTVGDGTNAGRGALASGLGPVQFSDLVPTGAIARRIIPRFINDLQSSIESEIVNQVFQNFNFGLRYDNLDASWKIILAANLNLTDDFTLGKAGDTSNTNLDSSWMLCFVKEVDSYVVRVRGMNYVFGSENQNRFYFDTGKKNYNAQTGSVIEDLVNVLSINKSKDNTSMLNIDIPFEIDSTIKFNDGYESSIEVNIGFRDTDADGVIDNPEAFEEIVGEDSELNYLYFKENVDESGQKFFALTTETIYARPRESLVSPLDDAFADGDLVYFYDPDQNRFKRVNKASNSFILETGYRANIGRKNLKFQYIHNAGIDRRIDPSSSNIIDVYLLTRSYDEAIRVYLAGGTSTMPVPADSESLRISFGTNLNKIKSISDEIIYHSVKYKILFGSKAESNLQAKFKVVKNPSRTVNDNDLKVRIISAVNEFFEVSNWDFGDRFYFSELTTYITTSVAPDLSNIVIVPRQPGQSFGTLFEIQSGPDEIFVSGATVDDVEIVTAITVDEINNGLTSV